jgi:hypothetical protein
VHTGDGHAALTRVLSLCAVMSNHSSTDCSHALRRSHPLRAGMW